MLVENLFDSLALIVNFPKIRKIHELKIVVRKLFDFRSSWKADIARIS